MNLITNFYILITLKVFHSCTAINKKMNNLNFHLLKVLIYLLTGSTETELATLKSSLSLILSATT